MLSPNGLLLLISIIAVQIKSYPLEVVLILLAFWTAMPNSQDQVHRRAAEIAEGYFFYDPIMRGDWIINLMPLAID
jgi:hypothetical protein